MPDNGDQDAAADGMAPLLADPAFSATSYVIIDFETLTPAGRPAEPVEVAAVTGAPELPRDSANIRAKRHRPAWAQ